MVSIIVPTLNEASNLPQLAARIDAAMTQQAYEVLIIDDASTDNTPEVCATISRQYPWRLIVREDRAGGLSGAVLHGFAVARGERLVVMDGDLQHPPEAIPALLAGLDAGAEFCLGSRYVSGGTTDDKWTLYRRLNSGVATLLARPFAGRTTDPMSGFFALPLSTLQRGRDLTPLGYKIALELICKCRVERLREVPIHFGCRTHGESKLSFKEQFRYLEHLSRLYDFCYPRLSPVIKFLIVTAIGWCEGLAMFSLCVSYGVGALWSIAMASATAILTQVVFQIRYVHTQRKFLPTPHPWRDFWCIAAAEAATCVVTAAWIVNHVRQPTASQFFILSFGVATMLRYVLRKELLQDIRGVHSPGRDTRIPRLGWDANRLRSHA